MKLRISMILFYLGSCTLLFSQVNTEFLRKDEVKAGLLNSVSLKFGLSSGNTNDMSLTGGYRIDYFSGDFGSFVDYSLQYKESESEVTARMSLLHWRTSYRILEWFSPELFFQKNYDYFIGLKDRNLIGISGRFELADLISKDSISFFNLFLGIGGMWEQETFFDSLDYTRSSVKSSNYISIFSKISNLLDCEMVSYFQINPENTQDFRFLTDLKLSINITAGLKLFVNLDHRYHNRLPETRKNSDIELSNGIAVKF